MDGFQSTPETLRRQINWYIAHLNEAFETGGKDAYDEARAWLGRNDLFYLLVYILHRLDLLHPWIYDRCCEVQKNPNGYLDLWAREHYKSTIMTFGLNIQDIINNPEITIGLFSHTRNISKAFLAMIKTELETNADLKYLFPDVFWQDPKKQSPRWSMNDGIVVKRKTNPNEATVEAWGVVESQPTSKHFHLLDYDDLVTIDTVNGKDADEKIKKCVSAWATSLNLGRRGGVVRYKGSKYHAVDPYREILRRKAAKLRLYPCTTNGEPDGEPVLLTEEENADKRREMGSYVYGCQMLLDPQADSTLGFRMDWLRYWSGDRWDDLTRCIIVDPAHKRKRTSDHTAMWVLGYGADKNWYAIDFVYDKLPLKKRAQRLIALHRDYQPKHVFYEEYGMQADIEACEWEQDNQTYHFDITPLGGKMPKADRIIRLQPICENHRLFMLERKMTTNWEKRTVDVIKQFLEDEYELYPVSSHDDGLDCLSRIEDEIVKDMMGEPSEDRIKALDPLGGARGTGSWQGM